MHLPRHRHLIPLVLAMTLGALTLPSAASADRRAEVSIMDDQLLLGAPQSKIDSDMDTFRALGVDRLRVSAFWNQLAPDSLSRTRPAGFDAANPNDPRYGWDPLDRVVASAHSRGMRIMISISTPAPIWATPRTRKPNPLWKPSVPEFAAFTNAVTRRYAPFVDHWGISNEPNQGVWLQPQSDRHGLFAPHHYRAMVQAAYPLIKANDPDSLALVGELASSGRRGRGAKRNIRPLVFLRAMACLNSNYRPIRRGRCRGFKPVPLDAIGHHPYQLLLRPTQRSLNRYDAAIGDGRRLIRFLDRLVRRGGLAPGRSRRLGVFYTEFGYQTNPPDPFASVSLAAQNSYLQQAAYLVWRTPRIRGLNQFRLTDGGFSGTGTLRFKEFQSGLLFRNRRRKPSFATFPDPFVITGSRFWGQVRPGGAHSVRVEFRRRRSGRFRLVAQVLTNAQGYFSFRLPGRRPGEYRYRYTEPVGTSGVVRLRR